MPDFMKQIERRMKDADKLAQKRRYDEARAIYEQIAAFFRDFRAAQYEEVPGQTIPLAVRLLVANRDLVVPLSRLGELHMDTANYPEAVRVLREMIEALQEAIRHSSDPSWTDECNSMLVDAQQRLAEAEELLGSRRPDAGEYNARYRIAIRPITMMARVPGEATLLLARRMLQRPIHDLTNAEVRRAVAEINELPALTAPLTDRQIDELVDSQGDRMRQLATELAMVYRDHPDLA